MARKHRETHTVSLDSGGKISFRFNFRSFRLTDRDRKLVTHLIDTVRDFEAFEVEETPTERGRKKRSSTDGIETAPRSKDPVGVDH